MAGVTLDVYTLRREAAAVEGGWHAIEQPASAEGRRFRVVSATDDRQRYDLLVPATYPGGVLVVRCPCPSGQYRRGFPVACWHGALVARRLEREAQVTWLYGLWYDARPWPSVGVVDDPFAGLTAEDAVL